MKVLFLSEIEPLQVLDIKTVLDKFLRTGVDPKYLKHIVESLDTQGFDIGKVDGIAHTIIKLNLPDSNLLILSSGELNILYNCAVIGFTTASELPVSVSSSLWMKVGELTDGIHKLEEKEEKTAHKGAKDYSHI